MHKLYIVESPFQLLGAMEHIYHYGKDTYVLVIRFSTENNTKQLQNMIDHFEFKNNSLKIIYGYQKSIFKRVYYEFKFLLWLFLNKNNFSDFILGDYHSRYLTYIRKIFLQKAKIIYLDDGSATIRTQNSFSQNSFFDLFTMHKLKSIENQTIIHHTFEYLKNHLTSNHVEEEDIVLILGNKFYEAGLLDKEYSEYILEKLIGHHKHENLLYVAHRGESDTKLEEIRKKHHIEVVRYDFPIELYGIYKNRIPKKVVSFFSTALYSLHKIYPSIEIIVYKIDISKFTNHRQAYENAYNNYAKEMNVIGLEE